MATKEKDTESAAFAVLLVVLMIEFIIEIMGTVFFYTALKKSLVYAKAIADYSPATEGSANAF